MCTSSKWFTYKTKLKLDKKVAGGVLHKWWNSGSVLLFVSLCVLSDLSHIPLCLDRKFDYWSDTLIFWDLIAAKKRFASVACFKIQVLESKTPHAVLELFLRNACDITYPYGWTVNFGMRLEAPKLIAGVIREIFRQVIQVVFRQMIRIVFRVIFG